MSYLKEEYTAEIRDLSHDGLGIATVQNKTVFIEGALPTELVRFNYLIRKSKYNIGCVTQILKPSLIRNQPPCPYYETCGGCSMQHIKPLAQIEIKQKRLLKQLEHFGKIIPKDVFTAIQGPIYHYRRRTRLFVQYNEKNGNIELGFKGKHSNRLTSINQCAILDPKISTLLPKLQAIFTSLSMKKFISQIEIALGDKNIAVLLYHKKILPIQDINMLASFAKDHHLSIYSSDAANQSNILESNSLHAVSSIRPIYVYETDKIGTGSLYYTLPESKLRFSFQPWDFIQVNALVNQSMVNKVMELLNPTSHDLILDLFCGIGNFTLPMAQKAKKVIGVEGSSNVMTRSVENAIFNKISNVEFFQSNLVHPKITDSWAKVGPYDKILLDPPRNGALELVKFLPKLKAKSILYISCDPATLARDLGILAQHGYYLKTVGVLDMFPQTSHIESLALLEKTDGTGS